MARGNRREAIVFDESDRRLFVETFSEACEMTRWEVFAWVLMDNHYHAVFRTPRANLVEGMKWFQNAYTRRLNSRHRLWGHLFGGRYRSVLVENRDYGGAVWRDYLRTVDARPPGKQADEDDPEWLNRTYQSSGLVKDHGERSAIAILDRASDHFGLTKEQLKIPVRGDPTRSAIIEGDNRAVNARMSQEDRVASAERNYQDCIDEVLENMAKGCC